MSAMNSICFNNQYIQRPKNLLDKSKNLLLSAINESAPLKRVKVERSPSPWIKELHTSALLKERDQLRYETHKYQTDEVRQRCRNIRNQLKNKQSRKLTLFYMRALRTNRPEEIWKTIH